MINEMNESIKRRLLRGLICIKIVKMIIIITMSASILLLLNKYYLPEINIAYSAQLQWTVLCILFGAVIMHCIHIIKL